MNFTGNLMYGDSLSVLHQDWDFTSLAMSLVSLNYTLSLPFVL